MAIEKGPIKAGIGNGIGPAKTDKAKTVAPGVQPVTSAAAPAKTAYGKTASGDKSFCNFRVKLGDKVYSLAEGQILTGHYKPYVRNSTKRYSETRFLILDPDATEYSSISEEDEVRVEIGYPEEEPTCKFVGKIKDKGRLEPNATIIYAIDNMAQLASSSGAAATSAADTPLDLAKKVDDTSKYKVASTTSAKLILTDRKTGEKTAKGSLYSPDTVSLAHPDIKIDTNVRITNILSKKTFTTKIADKSTKGNGYSASKALFKELGMSEVNPTDCKFEVLVEPPKQPNQRADAVKAGPDNGVPAAQKEVGAASKDLKYAQNTSYTADKPGTAKLQQTAAKALAVEAAQRGDSVIGSGNTIKEVSADQAQQVSTGLILNYTTQRDYFAAEPIFMKRTALQVQSGTGTITVQGWNVANKELVSATVASPGTPDPIAGLKVFPSPTGPIKAGEPIFPGCLYTWGDVTKGGTRVPKDKEIFQNAIGIAQVIDKITKEKGKGKWKINSWYRDDKANQAAGPNAAKDSPHLGGFAVDAIFPGFEELHRELFAANWIGGLAIEHGAYIHIDTRQTPTPRRRWTYPIKR